jgi:uncharacterized repeat protein (TIGR03847 family)
MSTSFEFLEPDHFTAGAIGEPGRRVFYLQARQADHVVSLRLEKQQVAALGEYLAGILADLPDAEPLPLSLELIEPVVAEWVVGSLAVAYEEADDRILLVAEELIVDEDEGEIEGVAADPTSGPEEATARFRLSRSQVLAFIRTAAELVTSGRPLCRLCGKPIDPDGHACPRLN